MNALASYILTVTAGAVLAAIIRQLAGSGTMGTLVKYLAGLFMALTVLSPLVDLQLPDLGSWLEAYRIEGKAASAAGEEAAGEAVRERITRATQTYILDKAAACGVDAEVEVHLDDEGIPAAVTLRGDFAPAVKKRLAQMIRVELGIGEEVQNWID